MEPERFNYNIYKSSPPVCILGKTNSVPTTPLCLHDPFKYYPHTLLGFSSGLFPSDFRSNNLYTYMRISSLQFMQHDNNHFILLNLIILIILGKEHKSQNSSLCTFL
jgi:hypothetical protein